MPFRFRSVLLVAGLFYAGAALAGEVRAPKGVIELFTSQGCSSCPPADAALGELVAQGDMVVLSYHVDYWNYLGWTDTLSSKENTERQYGYAKTFGRTGVYTPQAVINGRDHVKGTDLTVINDKVKVLGQNGKGLDVPVTAAMRGDEIEIEIGGGKGQADVVVAYFTKRQQVDVTKGENSGKNMEYWHAVYDVQSVGTWNGQSMKLTLPGKLMGKSKKDGCAILLQTSGPGGEPAAILGATVLMVGRKNY
ncbi:thioredoxin family protein [Neorhizobium sp. BETTINA12A]|jgi:hypothetical protein|uniref:DUF1223 domain-containing protein n=1 Tax=Neorhizobium sp. BETTINA12A TaxID=2908924 RepID=UPI001FF391A5|nr:thioredoxin family protein [Neorhizobium sp. BETTINA12A]MCJ9752735.1 thioredoxin family protein [Neorhizobium sp. BETTINA12A]